MSGFSERSELVGLLVDSGLLEQGATLKWTGSTHVKKVFALCERIVLYIKTATVRKLCLYSMVLWLWLVVTKYIFSDVTRPILQGTPPSFNVASIFRHMNRVHNPLTGTIFLEIERSLTIFP